MNTKGNTVHSRYSNVLIFESLVTRTGWSNHAHIVIRLRIFVQIHILTDTTKKLEFDRTGKIEEKRRILKYFSTHYVHLRICIFSINA